MTGKTSINPLCTNFPRVVRETNRFLLLPPRAYLLHLQKNLRLTKGERTKNGVAEDAFTCAESARVPACTVVYTLRVEVKSPFRWRAPRAASFDSGTAARQISARGGRVKASQISVGKMPKFHALISAEKEWADVVRCRWRGCTFRV